MIPGDGESGGTPLGNIAQHSGYFTAPFGNDPLHPMLVSAPGGPLGPAYHVTYRGAAAPPPPPASRPGGRAWRNVDGAVRNALDAALTRPQSAR